MNTTLTIEALRKMELPVRLINSKDEHSYTVLYISDYGNILVKSVLGDEWLIKDVNLRNYQLAPKTKKIKLNRYVYKTRGGRYTQTDWRSDEFHEINWNGDEPEFIGVEFKEIKIKETGEIISREVSAE